MTYGDIITKQGAKILITGDSLSYNRYGYDPEERKPKDAYCHGVGMQSWSFKLRDRIYFEDENFTFGDSLTFNCKAVNGIDNDSQVPNTAMFNGRVVTLYPEKEVEFDLPFDSRQIVLYLQNRLQNPCLFDVAVDDKILIENVDTTGDINYFAGYSLKVLTLPCEKGKSHTVKFVNIRGENPKITLAAVGSVYRQITLNGRGGECTDFFIDNFEDRIGRYNPDLIILSLTANDRIKLPPMMLRIQLLELFGKIFNRCPQVKILFLTPPNTHDPNDAQKDVGGFSSIMTAHAYNQAVEWVCSHLGDEGNNDFGIKNGAKNQVEVMRISSLFDDEDVSAWRFDNVHLNPKGNQILYNAMLEKLELKRD